MTTPSTSLSSDSIATAAEQVIDSEGLAALTMRRLGRELGVEAMSIYHHVPNKAALEELLIERLIAGASPVRATLPPDELLDSTCRHLRLAMLQRPSLAPLFSEHLPGLLPEMPNSISARLALVEAGFDDGAARWILDAFFAFAVGHVIIELADGDATTDDAAFETGLRFLRAGLREELGL